jgi:hypothetical protein
MSERERPTRWQKARDEWRGFQWRDLFVGLAGIVLAIVVLAATGRPVASLVEVAVIGGCGIAAAVFYAVGQLVWAWLQAPMRLLTADVIAIRERLEASPIRPSPSAPAPPNVRLTLLNYIRIGKSNLDNTLAALGGVDPAWESWTQEVLTFLNEHVSATVAEGFLTATDETGASAVLERIEYLEDVVNKRAEAVE